MNVRSPGIPHTRVRAAVGLAAIALLSACASTPPVPEASLQAARQSIAAAERGDARRYAATELSEARNQLAYADSAVAQKKMVIAERHALQSRVSADLATARTAAAKAALVNEEMKRSTGTLIDELDRSAGDPK